MKGIPIRSWKVFQQTDFEDLPVPHGHEHVGGDIRHPDPPRHISLDPPAVKPVGGLDRAHPQQPLCRRVRPAVSAEHDALAARGETVMDDARGGGSSN
eukprot:gene5264-biopygen5367